jgi:hypothetical protein
MVSIIGQRVEAWRGDRRGEEGVVVRTDTPYYLYIRWDDGEVGMYEAAAVIRTDLLRRWQGVAQ